MADPVTPTAIPPWPTPAPSPLMTPEEFDAAAFAQAAAFQPQTDAFNAAIAATNTNAQSAFEDATATAADRVATGQDRTATGQDATATAADRVATGQDATATAADRVATGQDRTATGQDATATAADRVATGQDRTATQQYRDQAAAFAGAQFTGTSTTANTPSAGTKTFATQSNKAFGLGQYIFAVSRSDPTVRVSGPLTSYNPTTGALVITADMFSGTGSKNDWDLTVGVSGGAGAGLLTVQRITANTAAVPNVHYVIGAAGIRLTYSNNFASDDRTAISEDITAGLGYEIDFGPLSLRGVQNGLTQVISNRATSNVWRYIGEPTGFI